MSITNSHHPEALNRCKILQNDIRVLIGFLLTRNKSLFSFNRMKCNRVFFDHSSNAFDTWLGLFLTSYWQKWLLIPGFFIINFIAYRIQISFTFLSIRLYSFYLFLPCTFDNLHTICIHIAGLKQILILLFRILYPLSFLDLLTLVIQVKYLHDTILLLQIDILSFYFQWFFVLINQNLW